MIVLMIQVPPRDPSAQFRSLSEARLLAIAIYGEARGEPLGGKIGVASVIMNRVKAGGWFGTSLPAVILKPKQFSCFNAVDPNWVTLSAIAADWDRQFQRDKALRECAMVAERVLAGDLPDNVMGATHYKTKTCAASWAGTMHLVAVIGNHEFYA